MNFGQNFSEIFLIRQRFERSLFKILNKDFLPVPEMKQKSSIAIDQFQEEENLEELSEEHKHRRITTFEEAAARFRYKV